MTKNPIDLYLNFISRFRLFLLFFAKEKKEPIKCWAQRQDISLRSIILLIIIVQFKKIIVLYCLLSLCAVLYKAKILKIIMKS